jgi:hypothetical protein
MAEQVINIGSSANDGTGDTLRESQRKARENFSELYASVSFVAPSTSFKFLQKGYGNFSTGYEIGDIFSGWKNDGTIRISEAKWLGGSLNDSDNFLPIIQTEI